MIRAELVSMAERDSENIPRIIGDFLVLSLSDLSFSSGFLSSEVKSLFEDLSHQPVNDSFSIPYMMLVLLWSNRQIMDRDDLKLSIGRLLETVSEVSDLDLEDEARVLLFLAVMENEDGRIVEKAIRKRLNVLTKRYPKIFNNLLPHRKRGFRKKLT